MRKRQPLRGVFERVEQQHIDVDRPRSVPGSARRATELAFDLLAGVQQLLGPERRLDPDARVEEILLIEYLSDRLGLVHRGGGQHPDAVFRQAVDGSLQVGPPVADVGPQPQVANGHLRGASSPAP